MLDCKLPAPQFCALVTVDRLLVSEDHIRIGRLAKDAARRRIDQVGIIRRNIGPNIRVADIASGSRGLNNGV